MSGDPRDEKQYDDLLRDLRAGARPDLEPGAARRIADGAWRAHAAEQEAKRVGGAWGRRGRGWRAARAVAAAGLLTAVGIGVVTWHGTEPAFAVDGDPVQVWDGERWEKARTVGVGSFVFVPDGKRTLRGPDGARIEPLPGAIFKLTASVGDLHMNVRVLSGRTEVAGPALTLDVADVTVGAQSTGTFHVDVEVVPTANGEFAAGASVAKPPANPLTIDWKSRPLIKAFGKVHVFRAATGDSLQLQPTEAATIVEVEDCDVPQLAKIEAWSADVAKQIRAGNGFVVDLANDHVVLWGERNFKCVKVPADAREKRVALRQLNEATEMYMPFVAALREEQAVDMRIQLETFQRLLEDAWTQRELSYVKNGESIVVRVLADGRVSLQRGDAPREEFESVRALRKEHPELAKLFGERLE